MSTDDALRRISAAAIAHGVTAAQINELATRRTPPANWQKWAHCPQAELWECIALSFDVEPIDAMRATPGSFVIAAEPKAKPWFSEHAEMRTRFEIALANVGFGDPPTLAPLPGQSGDIACQRFAISHFARWARSILNDLPTQLIGHIKDRLVQPIASTQHGTGAPLASASGISTAQDERARERHDRRLRTLLLEFGQDPDAVPRAPGGRVNQIKRRAFERAMETGCSESVGLGRPR